MGTTSSDNTMLKDIFSMSVTLQNYRKKFKNVDYRLKIVTYRRPPLQAAVTHKRPAINSQHSSPSRQHSRAIVAPRSLQLRYLPQSFVRVRDMTSLAVVSRQRSSTTAANEIVTTSKRLETASHSIVHAKEIRVAEKSLSGFLSVLPQPNFEHAENFPTNATDNSQFAKYVR